ncbi:acyl-CoA thioesterase [Zhihengliuella salsuginis]|uniref:Acyl-CoA thioesterase FadM n=1 Tax=Zhihengliuella salsuginis TaxID=578222 RepID=A0ABQ3GJF6_9MICC|nr:acyl-CoA thioesterase [Zhihengliuella salsuginis]GHD06642.1 hypothetical protein GCM10008096_16850 [Zhihengliuella salsuginis]
MHMIFRLILLAFAWRTRPKLGLFDVGRMPMRATLTDIDFAGHINNGMYFSIFDLGRFDLLLRAGAWQRIRRRRWQPVVQAETIRFRKSVELGTRFEIESRIVGLDERHAFLEQRIVVDGEVYASGMIAARFKGPKGPVPMSEVIDVLGADVPADLREPAWVADWLEETRLPSARRPAPSTW